MKRIKLICVVVFAVFGAVVLTVDSPFVQPVSSFSSGPPAGYTGAPGENVCSACHIPNATTGNFSITAPPTYVPGQTYQISVIHSTKDIYRLRWGFELTALNEWNEAAGTFANTSAFTQTLEQDGRYYIEHTTAGTFANQGLGAEWSFNWIAPATDVGPVTFYAAGNQANNDNSPDGDQIYTAFTVTMPAGATPTPTPTATPTPVTPTPTGTPTVTPTPSPTPCFAPGTLSGAQEVPPNNSTGTGTGTVSLASDGVTLTVNLSFSGLGSNATAAHIHGPAPAGTNAPILFGLTGVPAATSGSIPQQTFTLDSTQRQQLLDGLFYFNVHTIGFSGGEIRAQITQISCNATPTPTPTPTPPPTPFPEFDLRISQADSPDPVRVGEVLTYTLTASIVPAPLGGRASPVVRFNFPTGVGFSGTTVAGTNGYSATVDADGVTFFGGVLSTSGAPTATFTIRITPFESGELISIGDNVIIDPNNLINETNEDNNTAQTITTRIESGATFDYDADGRTDLSVFRPSEGGWYLQKSTEGFFGMQWGISSDKITPADFDGDGKTDIAVYRPSDGYWYIVNSSNGTFSFQAFGLAEDVPAPADYDGDGSADLCVFRPSAGVWFIQYASGGFFARQFGANEDKPTVGDFDGDGESDLAVFRPSNGGWYQIHSSDGSIHGEQFGFGSDKLAYADYDGDAKTDLAVFRQSDGVFYIKYSATSTYVALVFGVSIDIPAPGDYDGDGRADISVFRPSDGNWYSQHSSNGSFNAFQFGANGDQPTPTAYH